MGDGDDLSPKKRPAPLVIEVVTEPSLVPSSPPRTDRGRRFADVKSPIGMSKHQAEKKMFSHLYPMEPEHVTYDNLKVMRETAVMRLKNRETTMVGLMNLQLGLQALTSYLNGDVFLNKQNTISTYRAAELREMWRKAITKVILRNRFVTDSKERVVARRLDKPNERLYLGYMVTNFNHVTFERSNSLELMLDWFECYTKLHHHAGHVLERLLEEDKVKHHEDQLKAEAHNRRVDASVAADNTKSQVDKDEESLVGTRAKLYIPAWDKLLATEKVKSSSSEYKAIRTVADLGHRIGACHERNSAKCRKIIRYIWATMTHPEANATMMRHAIASLETQLLGATEYSMALDRAFEALVDPLSNTIDAYEEMAMLKKQLAQQRGINSMIHEQLQTVTQEKEDAEAEMRKRSLAHRAKTTRLEEQLVALQQQLDNSKQSYDDLTTQYEGLKDTNKSLEETLQGLSEIHLVTQRLYATIDELKAKQRDLEEKAATVKPLREQLAKARSRVVALDGMAERFKASQDEVVMLRGQIQGLQRSLKDQAAQHETDVNSYKRQLLNQQGEGEARRRSVGLDIAQDMQSAVRCAADDAGTAITGLSAHDDLDPAVVWARTTTVLQEMFERLLSVPQKHADMSKAASSLLRVAEALEAQAGSVIRRTKAQVQEVALERAATAVSEDLTQLRGIKDELRDKLMTVSSESVDFAKKLIEDARSDAQSRLSTAGSLPSAARSDPGDSNKLAKPLAEALAKCDVFKALVQYLMQALQGLGAVVQEDGIAERFAEVESLIDGELDVMYQLLTAAKRLSAISHASRLHATMVAARGTPSHSTMLTDGDGAVSGMDIEELSGHVMQCTRRMRELDPPYEVLHKLRRALLDLLPKDHADDDDDDGLALGRALMASIDHMIKHPKHHVTRFKAALDKLKSTVALDQLSETASEMVNEVLQTGREALQETEDFHQELQRKYTAALSASRNARKQQHLQETSLERESQDGAEIQATSAVASALSANLDFHPSDDQSRLGVAGSDQSRLQSPQTGADARMHSSALSDSSAAGSTQPVASIASGLPQAPSLPKSVEADLQRMTCELQSAQERLSELETERDELTQALAACHRENEVSAKERHAAEAERDALAAELAHFQRAVETLRFELEAARQAQSSLQSELHAAQQAHAALESELAEEKQTAQDVLAEAQDRVAQLEERLAEVEDGGPVDRTQSIASQCSIAQRGDAAAVAELQAKVQELTGETEGLRAALEEARSQASAGTAPGHHISTTASEEAFQGLRQRVEELSQGSLLLIDAALTSEALPLAEADLTPAAFARYAERIRSRDALLRVVSTADRSDLTSPGFSAALDIGPEVSLTHGIACESSLTNLQPVPERTAEALEPFPSHAAATRAPALPPQHSRPLTPQPPAFQPPAMRRQDSGSRSVVSSSIELPVAVLGAVPDGDNESWTADLAVHVPTHGQRGRSASPSHASGRLTYASSVAFVDSRELTPLASPASARSLSPADNRRLRRNREELNDVARASRAVSPARDPSRPRTREGPQIVGRSLSPGGPKATKAVKDMVAHAPYCKPLPWKLTRPAEKLPEHFARRAAAAEQRLKEAKQAEERVRTAHTTFAHLETPSRGAALKTEWLRDLTAKTNGNGAFARMQRELIALNELYASALRRASSLVAMKEHSALDAGDVQVLEAAVMGSMGDTMAAMDAINGLEPFHTMLPHHDEQAEQEVETRYADYLADASAWMTSLNKLPFMKRNKGFFERALRSRARTAVATKRAREDQLLQTRRVERDSQYIPDETRWQPGALRKANQFFSHTSVYRDLYDSAVPSLHLPLDAESSAPYAPHIPAKRSIMGSVHTEASRPLELSMHTESSEAKLGAKSAHVRDESGSTDARPHTTGQMEPRPGQAGRLASRRDRFKERTVMRVSAADINAALKERRRVLKHRDHQSRPRLYVAEGRRSRSGSPALQRAPPLRDGAKQTKRDPIDKRALAAALADSPISAAAVKP